MGRQKSQQTGHLAARRLQILKEVCQSRWITTGKLSHRLKTLNFAFDHNQLIGDIRALQQDFPFLVTIPKRKRRSTHTESSASIDRAEQTIDIIMVRAPVRTGDGLDARLKRSTVGKWRVANYAAELIRNGDLILIGGGGSAVLLAFEIAKRTLPNLRIMTTSLYLADILPSAHTFYLIGGKLAGDSLTLDEEPSVTICRSRPRLSFVGVEAVSRDHGCSSGHPERGLLRLACEQTDGTLIIMTDHTEIRPCVDDLIIRFDELEAHGPEYIVVTDDAATLEERQRLREVQSQFPDGRFVIV